MKRQIWPDNYSQPGWMDSRCYEADARTQKESSLRCDRWMGALIAFALVGFFGVWKDDDSGDRIFSRHALVMAAFSGAGISLIGYLFIGDPHDNELIERWLKYKARADSFEREWTSEELSEIKRNAEWIVNFRANNADETEQRRLSKWWSKLFWANVCCGEFKRPKPHVSRQALYLQFLAKEVTARMGTASLRAREKENLRA